MTEFGGWDMPLFYTGIVAEHMRTRTICSLFDTCHMGELELSGPTAAADLERLFTRKVSDLAPGKCRYGYLLNPQGGVIDDLTCYRLQEERFLLVVNAATTDADARWISAHLSPATVLRNRSGEIAKLDLQGPRSPECFQQAFGRLPPDLRFYSATYMDLNGVRCLISRSGYTGEMGYELYFPQQHAAGFWRRLLAAEGVSPAGLGARDTLRLEMGYPLYGHELTPDRTPAGVAHGRFLDLDKDFIGRDAVLAEMESGPREILTGIILEGRRAARHGDPVLVEEHTVGIVTSGSYAPSVGKAVALAYVAAEFADEGRPVILRSRSTDLYGTIASPPFHTVRA